MACCWERASGAGPPPPTSAESHFTRIVRFSGIAVNKSLRTRAKYLLIKRKSLFSATTRQTPSAAEG